MNLWFSKNKSKIIHHLSDQLFKNSFFIMLASVSSAAFGFIFWMLAAKIYSPEDVGIATALISSMALLVLISRFGMDFSIIRFFPTYDKSRIYSTSTIIMTSFAIIFGVIFIVNIDIFSPELNILKTSFNGLLYLTFLAASSFVATANISFIANRNARFQFLQTFVVGSRIVFLVPFIALGASGIFNAVGISFILAVILAHILLIWSNIRLSFVVDRNFLIKTFRYSAGNYLSGLFMTAPNMILPIMVLNILGAEQAAYYYIVFMVASLLFIIPNAISTSLFVEGSHGELLKKTVLKSIIAVISLLIPAIVFLHLYGGWLLGLVGVSYSENGLELLKIMILASMLMAINSIYLAIARIKKDLRKVIILSGIIGGSLVGLGYVFMLIFGVVGVGYAWLMSYGIGIVIIGFLIMKEESNKQQ